MPGVELRTDTADRRGVALNAIFGVGIESVNAMAEVMLLPSLVLAFFVAELTPSYTTIGLVPAVAASLWTAARLPAHLLTGSQPRQQPWAFGAALVRGAAITILAVIASRTDPAGLAQSGRPLLITFFLCLIVFTVAGGFGSVPTAALLRSSIPTDRWHGFTRWRALWSMALSLIGALVVARLLGPNGLPFPGNYGRLFLAAAVCLIAVAVFIVAMREPWTPPSPAMAPFLPPRALRQPLFDARYRRFLLFRVLLSASAAIDPFLFLYAVTRLGAPVTMLGTYLVAGVLGWIVSAPIWIWLERRSSARAVLQSAAVLRLVAPALALVLPQLAGVALVRERTSDGSLAHTIFALGFAAIGAALAAQSRGNGGYLTPLAPRALLPAYSGLTNGVLVVIAFSPVVAGLVIERFGYEALFIAAIVIGLIAVFAGGWLAAIPAALGDWPGIGRRGARIPPALPATRL